MLPKNLVLTNFIINVLLCVLHANVRSLKDKSVLITFGIVFDCSANASLCCRCWITCISMCRGCRKRLRSWRSSVKESTCSSRYGTVFNPQDSIVLNHRRSLQDDHIKQVTLKAVKQQEERLEKEATVQGLKERRDQLVEKQQRLQQQVQRHGRYGDFLEEVVKMTKVLQV